MAAPRPSRAFVVVINNPTVDDYRSMDTVTCVYMIYQTEKAPTTGTIHIQGYVYFKSAKTMARAVHLLGGRASLKIPGGTHAQNKDYCSKTESRVEGMPWKERGVLPRQGKTDMSAMMADVLVLSNVEMLEKYLVQWHRYRRTLTEYRREKQPARTKMTKVLTLWGPTGTGKSRRAGVTAAELDPDYAVWMVMDKGATAWADGCEGHKAVILEDFDGQIPFRSLLQMLDEHKCTMPVKGGSTKWAPELVIITSNIEPMFWYADQDYAPLKRRLEWGDSEIVHMTDVYVVPIIMAPQPARPPAPGPLQEHRIIYVDSDSDSDLYLDDDDNDLLHDAQLMPGWGHQWMPEFGTK